MPRTKRYLQKTYKGHLNLCVFEYLDGICVYCTDLVVFGLFSRGLDQKAQPPPVFKPIKGLSEECKCLERNTFYTDCMYIRHYIYIYA